MGRKVITRESIDSLLRDGATELVVEPGTIVTDAASDYAQDRGVRLVSESAAVGREPDPVLTAATAAKVRAGVIARLGHTPDGLDAAIARVLGK